MRICSVQSHNVLVFHAGLCCLGSLVDRSLPRVGVLALTCVLCFPFLFLSCKDLLAESWKPLFLPEELSSSPDPGLPGFGLQYHFAVLVIKVWPIVAGVFLAETFWFCCKKASVKPSMATNYRSISWVPKKEASFVKWFSEWSCHELCTLYFRCHACRLLWKVALFQTDIISFSKREVPAKRGGVFYKWEFAPYSRINSHGGFTQPTLSLLYDLSCHIMSMAVPLPNSCEWLHHIGAPAPTGVRGKKIWRLHHTGNLPALPQRDVWLRHIGAPTRTLSHNPLYLQLPPHICIPPVVVFYFVSVFSSSFLDLFCLFSAGLARRVLDPKWSAPWHDFNFPAVAFLSSRPCGCWTRAKPYAGWPWSPTSMTSTTLDRCSQHLAFFPVLASRLQYRNMAYR